jgi:HSP20 family protein
MARQATRRERRPARPGYVIGPTGAGGPDVQLVTGRPPAQRTARGRSGATGPERSRTGTRRRTPRPAPPRLPVRLYQTGERLTIAAPMPGLQPKDIRVKVAGDRVVIHGEERGPHQHGLDLLLEEWTIGPYHREVDLPAAVDGSLANATYGNGVLVLSLPRATGRGVRAELRLTSTGATRGEHVGHVGREARPAGRTARA